MGLDMYLFRVRKDADITNGLPNNNEREEIMYWRKANQIREWFCTHLDDFQDNGITEVPKAKLEELARTIGSVLNDRSRTNELPTSSGFFFGSQEYDEWYWEELEGTYRELNSILSDFDFDSYRIVYWEWY